VVDQLTDKVGSLDGRTVEIHAGAAYADPIRDHLVSRGAMVVEPLRGLRMGQRLAWYAKALDPDLHLGPTPPASNINELVGILGRDDGAVTPAEFLARGGSGLKHPGLYSWWVDAQGAADLTRGLGEPVDPGLIYAGLAGATKVPSGKKSTNTLWGRIRGMHLGGRHEFSTFRLSLGSVLASAAGSTAINEDKLTSWMHAHLRLVAVIVEDADALGGLETGVLAALNPPLNLDKMPTSPLRLRLSELRRKYRQKA
jgi:hypothetical protein